MPYQRKPDYQLLGQYHCEHFNVSIFCAVGPAVRLQWIWSPATVQAEMMKLSERQQSLLWEVLNCAYRRVVTFCSNWCLETDIWRSWTSFNRIPPSPPPRCCNITTWTDVTNNWCLSFVILSDTFFLWCTYRIFYFVSRHIEKRLRFIPCLSFVVLSDAEVSFHL